MEPSTRSLFIWGGAAVVVVLLIAGLAYYFGGTTAPRPAGDLYTGGKLSEAVSASDWQKGADDPSVTIVKYSDFQCPACAAYSSVLSQLVQEFPDEVKVVYRHYPLPYHRQAELAALFTEAAGKQGKFWEMHDVLFANQTTWAEKSNAREIFLGYARDLGLDITQLESDIENSAIARKINDQKQGGTVSGVDATPSFFVNGEKIINPRTYGEFAELVNSIINGENTSL